MPTLDMADVKPTVLSFLEVGIMAVLFIVLFKAVANRFRIPGLTDLANAV